MSKMCDVYELKKSDGKGGMVPCMLAYRRTIQRFIRFIHHKRNQGDPNSPSDDAASYTEADFQQFSSSVHLQQPPRLLVIFDVINVVVTGVTIEKKSQRNMPLHSGCVWIWVASFNTFAPVVGL